MELICTSEFFKKLKLQPYFSHSRKLLSEFPFKICVTALHDIISLQNFSSSFCQSLSRIMMCNLHWCYTFCTGVTLFALVLHLNCTALSQSDSSNFFMCIINSLNSQYVVARETRVEPRVTRYKPCRPPTPPTACQVTDMDVLPVALILNSQALSVDSPRPPRPCPT